MRTRSKIALVFALSVFLVADCVLIFGIILLVVFDGSGTWTNDLGYHENGRLRQVGGHSWTGRGGVWVAWNPDGQLDRKSSGNYTAGFRITGLDDDDVRAYTEGRTRLEVDLRACFCALRTFERAHAGALPSSMDALIFDSESRACLPGSSNAPIDPWGRVYRYARDSDHNTATVYTYGRDGKPRGRDVDGDYAMVFFSGTYEFSDQAPE